MVVNDLDFLWPSCGPPKTDPPLVVDSNAVLTPPIAFQRLEPVSRRNPQLLKALRLPNLSELAESHRVYAGIDRANPFSVPQPLGVFVSKRPDLDVSYPHNAKRQ